MIRGKPTPAESLKTKTLREHHLRHVAAPRDSPLRSKHPLQRRNRGLSLFFRELDEPKFARIKPKADPIAVRHRPNIVCRLAIQE
jgi:hypothetical protein